MCRKMIFIVLFVSALGGVQAQEWDRAAYWDDRYPSAWAGTDTSIRDGLEAAGYTILDADELKTWMDAHIADQALSVVVFCKDAAPETVAESMSSNCTLRRYLDAGGKIVWYSDIPFYYLGHPDGTTTTWGDSGAPAVLGFNTAGATRDTYNEVVITEAGYTWGLTETWQSRRPAAQSATDFTILATDSTGSAAAWVKHYVPGDTYRGFVRMFDTDGVPASVDDVIRLAEYIAKTASFPDPADGAIHPKTWVSLQWTPGAFAASHDVYFGDSFDEVNEATPESDVFQVNQTDLFLIIGIPESTYPDALIPGTTYYWRIDDVGSDGITTCKGEVWSFTVPPRKSYNHIPADGAFFIDPNVELSWDTGFGARLHHLYFGESYADVEAGTIDTDKGLMALTQYTPGTLELGKTYYWRVDELEAPEIHTGDVLSFTVTSGGGGVRADYYRGMNFSNPVLTRIDPEINFDWAETAPDEAVGEDNFSIRWTGEVGAPLTETYTFYTNTDDGVRLWVDGRLLIDDWNDQSATENRATIDLVAGRTYSIVMEYYDNTVDAVAQLRWESSSIPKQTVPTYVLFPPVKASSPNPPNGGVDIKQTPILKWGAGDNALSHQVYFGTDEEAVRNSTTASPEYKGTRDLGAESYDPGQLEWDTTYYWRVDETNDLNPESPWIGNLWSFTTANFLIVDNFEDYNDYEPERIFDVWLDGYGITSNGSTVGYEEPDFAAGEHFVETTNVHSGAQSMPYFYDNNSARNSEATLTLTYPTNWTERDVNTLTIWFNGNPTGFLEEPAGTFTIVASGTDIWDTADEFRYAFRQLSGDGEIIAKVESIENTDGWAKAGVMIRDTLEPDSRHAFCCMSVDNGKSFQNRPLTGQDSYNSNTAGVHVPYWVRLVRQGNTFTGYHSADGVNWEMQASSGETDNPTNITMMGNAYIGLAVTSHNAEAMCTAVFSNIQTTGSVTPMTWMHQAIGVEMLSNDAEPMYVVLNDSAVIYNGNPNAALTTEWTDWNINLQLFADQGINLTNITSIGLGFGDRSNPQLGGSGLVYFDDIRLHPPQAP
jgi:hypothetical protein